MRLSDGRALRAMDQVQWVEEEEWKTEAGGVLLRPAIEWGRHHLL